MIFECPYFKFSWKTERQHQEVYIAAFLQINSVFPFHSCLISVSYEQCILYSPSSIFILHYKEIPKGDPSDSLPFQE